MLIFASVEIENLSKNNFRENGGSGQFAKIRLDNTDNALKRLLPEVGLLDPEIGSRRLQPLERQAMEYQTRVINLNQSNLYEPIKLYRNKAFLSNVNGCIIRLRA